MTQQSHGWWCKSSWATMKGSHKARALWQQLSKVCQLVGGYAIIPKRVQRTLAQGSNYHHTRFLHQGRSSCMGACQKGRGACRQTQILGCIQIRSWDMLLQPDMKPKGIEQDPQLYAGMTAGGQVSRPVWDFENNQQSRWQWGTLWSTCIGSWSGCSDASTKSSLKGSGSSLGSLGGSVSIGSPCPDKDSPVKGLNIEDVPVRSLESLSCWLGSLSLGPDSDLLSLGALRAPLGFTAGNLDFPLGVANRLRWGLSSSGKFFHPPGM